MWTIFRLYEVLTGFCCSVQLLKRCQLVQLLLEVRLMMESSMTVIVVPEVKFSATALLSTTLLGS